MELVCGVFSSSVAADWVAAFGTAVAAVAVLAIYRMQRSDREASDASRWRVVNAVMRDLVLHVAEWGAQIDQTIEAIWKDGRSNDPQFWANESHWLRVPCLDRLAELQKELFQFGISGDSIVAAYIETCRTYEDALKPFREGVAMEGEARTLYLARLRGIAHKLMLASGQQVRAAKAAGVR